MIENILIFDEITLKINKLNYPSNINENDLKELILKIFELKNKELICLKDNNNNIIYPFSFIIKYSKNFKNGIYKLIYKDNDDYQNNYQNNNNNNNKNDNNNNYYYENQNETYDKNDNDNKNDNEIIQSNIDLSLFPLRFLNGFFNIIIEEYQLRTGLNLNNLAVYYDSLNQFAGNNHMITKGRFLSSMVYVLHQPEIQQNEESIRPVSTDINEIFERMFDAFFDNETLLNHTEVDIIRLCRLLALFSGGTLKENHKLLYYLFDYDGDGLLSFNDLYNCFRDYLVVLSRLSNSIFDIEKTYPIDNLSLSLAQNVIAIGQSIQYGGSEEEEEDDDDDDDDDDEKDEDDIDRNFNYNNNNNNNNNNSYVNVANLSQKKYREYLQQQQEEKQQHKHSQLKQQKQQKQQIRRKFIGDGVLTLQQFYHWYSNTERILSIPLQFYSTSISTSTTSTYPSLVSYKHISTVKKILSFHPMTCSTLKLSLQYFAQSSFISSNNIFSSLIIAFRIHQKDIFSLHCPTAFTEPDFSYVIENSQYLYTMETIIRQIFELFDPLHSGCVPIEDIFASLSLFLDTTWLDRLINYIELNPNMTTKHQLILSPHETLLQIFITEKIMIDYLFTVLSTITSFTSENKNDELLIYEATNMIQHALNTGLISSQTNGQVKIHEFAEWLNSNIDIGDPNYDIESNPNSPNSPVDNFNNSDNDNNNNNNNIENNNNNLSNLLNETQLKNISNELKNTKHKLGLVGFTAEDFMDLLGESANTGLLTLSTWLHLVDLMCQLNPKESSNNDVNYNEIDESLNNIPKDIFNSLITITSSSSSSSSLSLTKIDNEPTVSYNILLSALIMFCDSPEEDKIAVIFLILSETLNGNQEQGEQEEQEISEFSSNLTTSAKRITFDKLYLLIYSIFVVVKTSSITFSQLLDSMNVDLSFIARSTLLYAIQLSNLPNCENLIGYNMEEFCSLIWSILELSPKSLSK